MSLSLTCDRWSGELEKGLAKLREGDFPGARRHFEVSLELAPDQPLCQYALGRELARDGEFAEAKVLLRRAWSTDPTLIGAAATLARGLGLDERDFEAADEILDSARTVGLEVATLDIVSAELYIERGDFVRARAAADAAVECDESDSVALGAQAVRVRADNLEGVSLAAAGDHETALFFFRRALARDPEWIAPRLNSGLSFETLDRMGPALAAANDALAIDPDNADAIALRARLLFRDGKGGEATTELASAVEAHPEATGLAVMLADMFAAGGDLDSAASILIDLLAQDPTDARAWLTLGRAQAEAGAIGAAEECFRQALELDPENPDIMTVLADLLVRDGRYFEAAALAQRAQRLATESPSRYVCGDTRLATTRSGPRSGRRPGRH